MEAPTFTVVRTEYWENQTDEEVQELFRAVLGEEVEVVMIDLNEGEKK